MTSLATLLDVFYNIIRSMRAFFTFIVDKMTTTVGELIVESNSPLLKELLLQLVIPDTILHAPIYTIIFGSFAFTYMLVCIVKRFLP